MMRSSIWIAITLWLCGCAADGSREAIETESLCIIDREGRTRLRIGCAGESQWEDGPAIRMYDLANHERLLLSMRDSGDCLVSLSDPRGVTRAVLSVSSEGPTRLTLMDEAGASRLSLGLGPTGQGVLIIRNADGSDVVEIPVRGPDDNRVK